MIFPLNKRRQLPKEEPLPRQGFLLFHDLNYRVILRRRRGKSSSALLLKEAPNAEAGRSASPAWFPVFLPTLQHCVDSWATVWAARTPHTFTAQSFRAKALVAQLIKMFTVRESKSLDLYAWFAWLVT